MQPSNYLQRLGSISLLLFFQLTRQSSAFRTSVHTTTLPVKMQSIDKTEILQRLGVSICNNSGDPATFQAKYSLQNEHELLCPITGAHHAVLCTAASRECCADFRDAESIANNHDLVSQVISCGALAASIRNRQKNGDSLYYLPFVVTLVESFMAEEISSMLLDEIVSRDFTVQIGGDDCGGLASSLVKDIIFNSAGLETNEILMDLSDADDVMLYACNTQMDERSATSDVYLIPTASQSKRRSVGKVWRFTIDYKLATVNLSQIRSFGRGDSTTPLRPDVWLKDDCY